MDKVSIFFNDQCTVLLNKVIKTIYDKNEALQYVPLAPAEGKGVEKIKWRKETAVGIAKIISEYATDLPSVELYGEEVESRVHHIGIEAGWNKWELERAMKTGEDIIGKKDSAARLGIETKVDRMVWFGDKSVGTPGFVDYEGVTIHTLPNSAQAGHTGSKKWTDKSPAEIAQDITDMVTVMEERTHGNESPNTLLLPTSLYRLITTKYVDSEFKVSILDLIKKNNPKITTIAGVNALNKANKEGNGGRIVLYNKDPDKLEFHLPVPLDQEETEKKGFRYTTAITATVGCVTIYYPQSVMYADGAN